MDLRDLPTTLRRRWYLTIVGVLATIGICLAVFLAFPPTYEAKASILLLPPKTAVGEGGNPYLLLADLGRAVDVVTRTLSSQAAVDATAAIAPSGTYQVAPDYETNGPIFIITADDTTPDATLKTLKAVTDMVPVTLIQLQESLGIANQSQITSSILAADDRPSTVRKAQIRAVIAAGAGGALASVLFIALIDSFLIRRGRRKESDAPSAESSRNVIAAPGGGAASDRLRRLEAVHSGRPRRLGLSSPPPSGDDAIRESAEAAGWRRTR